MCFQRYTFCPGHIPPDGIRGKQERPGGGKGRIVGKARLTNTRGQAAGCMETGPTGFPKQNSRTTGVFVWKCMSVIVCVCVYVCGLFETNNDEFGRYKRTTINTARRLEHRHADFVLQDKKIEGGRKENRKKKKDRETAE